jgi:hypothetical protein
VAVLAAVLVEERHPRLAPVVEQDERHPWRRVLDTTELLRAAGRDPLRAMGLAARERALGGDPHVRAEGYDPDLLALRHALRVHCVLLTSTASGEPPSPSAADRYVREQLATAVLLGAEPDDLPATLDEVTADVATVRAEVAPAASPAEPGGCVDEPEAWERTCRLALSVLPAWARCGPAPLVGDRLAAELQRL